MPRVEICVDDAAGALIAEREGADRVELCADLSVGGVTPPDADIREVAAVARPDFTVAVMIRPRGGDFHYSPDELEQMRSDIVRFKEWTPAEVGFVAGPLTADGRVDTEALALLREAAEGREFTFHRAFDEVADLDEALDQLIAAGVTRVLTGGGPGPCDRSVVRHLLERAQGRITIMACGGLRAENVAETVAESAVESAGESTSACGCKSADSCGIPDVHGRAPFPGGELRDVDGRTTATDPQAVRAFVDAYRGAVACAVACGEK